MVTTLFLLVSLTPVTWLLGLMPTVTEPSQIANIPTVATQLAGYVAQFSNWIPGYVLGPCAAFVLSCFVFHVVVRIGRVVISHLPFIGGDSGG